MAFVPGSRSDLDTPTPDFTPDPAPEYDPNEDLGTDDLSDPESSLAGDRTPATETDELRNKLKPKAGKADNVLEAEVSGSAPQEVTDKRWLAEGQLAESQALQLEARMVGLGHMANVNAELANHHGMVMKETIDQVNHWATQAEAQMSIAQDLIDAARGNRINPGQFFENVGQAGQFASSIAIAAGYMAQTSLGGVNLASQIIEGAINRNVRAQEQNQLHDRAMITQQLSFVDKLRQLGVDRGNIGNLHQAMLIATTQAQLDSIKAATGSAEHRAMIDQLYDGLQARYWQAISAYYENIKATFRVKYGGIRDAIAKTNAGLMAAQTAIRGAGGITNVGPVQPALPAGRSAAYGKRGQRGGSRPTGPGTVGAYGEVEIPAQEERPAPTVEDENLMSMEGGQSQAQEPIPTDRPRPQKRWSTWEEGVKQARANAPKNRAQLADYIDRVKAENPELEGVPFEAFVPIETALNEGFAERVQLGSGYETYRTKKRLRDLKKNSYSEYNNVLRKIETRGKVYEWSKDLGNLISKIGMLKYWNTGEGSPAANWTDAERAGYRRELEGIMQNMANETRTEGGSDAIRAVSEWAIWIGLVGPKEITDDMSPASMWRKVENAMLSWFEGNNKRPMKLWSAGDKMNKGRLTAAIDPYYYREATLYNKAGERAKDAPE